MGVPLLGMVQGKDSVFSGCKIDIAKCSCLLLSGRQTTPCDQSFYQSMADESLLKQLTAETRTKLRSAQILTSLPIIISELMQNAIDAGASQIDIGVDCAEWSCWVMDNGSGITREGLRKLGQEAEDGRYSESGPIHSVGRY